MVFPIVVDAIRINLIVLSANNVANSLKKLIVFQQQLLSYQLDSQLGDY